MMVDAIQSNLNLIIDLHEMHGVPLDFVYKGRKRRGGEGERGGAKGGKELKRE